MSRKSNKPHRRTRQNVLEVRVMSPRLAWIGLLRLLGKLLKIACVLALITAVGWGVWRGVQHTFHNNPDFRLQIIDLNPNPVIDEVQLVELAGIDLAKEPSLFDVDVDYTRHQLEQLPAIVEARVERHQPGSLVVRVVCRHPCAWIATTGTDLEGTRRSGGLLVDAKGYIYPCPPQQAEMAHKLPIILVSPSDQYPITSGRQLDHPELQHCFNLLSSIRQADPDSPHWIESIRQANDWSLRLVTREGTSATFGISQHAAQINKLRAALQHAAVKGYQIDTINLIPRFNVPVTVRGESQAPPRAIPVSEASIPADTGSLSNLLQSH